MNILKNIYHFLINIKAGSVYIGFGFGMFLESLGIPFASAPFLIISSEKVGENILTYIFSVLSGSIGGTLGSSISYGIGKGIIAPFRKLKKNNSKNSKKRSKTGEFIKKYGEFSVFLAQLIGQTRTFISFPAGVLKFNFKKFVFYTFVGSTLWCALTLGLISVINRLWHKYKPLVEVHSGLAIIILFVVIVFISQIWIYLISKRAKRGGN